VLFFIDETWQEIAGQRVGALGAIAIPQDQYNGFCTAVYAMKKTVLGASELMHSEIKGQNCFTKSAFKRQALFGDSHWIKAAGRMLQILAAHEARAFVIWTTTPDLLTLRQPHSTKLSEPYKQLLFDCRALMEREAPRKLGSLNFDLRGTREDEATACTMQNYMVRTRGGWNEHFICIPNFTISAVSPGLQAADMIAYLGARLYARTERPELQPFVGRMLGLTYQFTRHGVSARSVRTARRVR
jgi:Protein of unknown function (DUF3800)